jgi:ppGpp synthetase/RelA/SpoT-type nucleotidyltranferase
MTLSASIQLSRSALDKLGKRLIGPDRPTDQDLALISAFQKGHSIALMNVLSVIDGVLSMGPAPLKGVKGVSVTHRVKTLDSLRAKLRRNTGLGRMQDVVGVRIVGTASPVEQEDIVSRLSAQFQGARIEDRRNSPSRGYRAIHLVPMIDGRYVEIQVRTFLQHMWANASEQMADKWGRGIRYGEEATGNSIGQRMKRDSAYSGWIEVADSIAALENVLKWYSTRIADMAAGDIEASTGRPPKERVRQILADDPALGRAVQRAASELFATIRQHAGPFASASVKALTQMGYGGKR